MNSLQSSLYTVAVAVCLFSAGVLGRRKSHTGQPLTYFTAFLALQSVGFTLELLMAHPAAPFKSLWLGLRMSSALLLAPCLWLAIRESVTGGRPKLSLLGRQNILLILVGSALTIPLILTAHAGLQYSNPERVLGELHRRAIHGAMLGCVALFAWQVPHYLLRCRRLLQEESRTNDVRAGVATSSAWISLLLVVVCTTWALGVLRTLQCAFIATGPGLTLLIALTEVGVTVGAMYGLVRRAALREQNAGLALGRAPVDELMTPTKQIVPQDSKSVDEAEAPACATVEPGSAPVARYIRSPIDAAVRARISRKLERALQDETCFCNPLLSLRSLSSALKDNAHHVSQVLNQDLGSNFYAWVNRRRIEHAQHLLVIDPDRSVLEIALAVGFNSKSTFNTAFRTHAGTTPREYRAASRSA